jgi:hypothetical protein
MLHTGLRCSMCAGRWCCLMSWPHQWQAWQDQYFDRRKMSAATSQVCATVRANGLLDQFVLPAHYWQLI